MRRRKRLTIVRIALAAAAAAVVLPVTAQAQPPAEIPYLSHGQGVDAADFGVTLSPDDRNLPRGAGAASTQTIEIPYLSHGVGVSAPELGIVVGSSPDDRAFSRAPNPDTAPVAGDGGGIDLSPYAVTGVGLSLLLVIGLMGLAVRQSRKSTLTPA